MHDHPSLQLFAQYFYVQLCPWKPPEDFASFQLLGIHRQTDCDMQLTIVGKANALQTSTSIYQRSCRKNKPSLWMSGNPSLLLQPGVAGVALSRGDDKCGHQVSAALCSLLTFLPSSNGCGKELFKKVTLVKTSPLSTFRAKAAVASCLPFAASCPLLHFQGAPAITGSLLPSILKKGEEMGSLNKIA